MRGKDPRIINTKTSFGTWQAYENAREFGQTYIVNTSKSIQALFEIYIIKNSISNYNKL